MDFVWFLSGFWLGFLCVVFFVCLFAWFFFFFFGFCLFLKWLFISQHFWYVGKITFQGMTGNEKAKCNHSMRILPHLNACPDLGVVLGCVFLKALALRLLPASMEYGT